jgi:hypothetical protein
MKTLSHRKSQCAQYQQSLNASPGLERFKEHQSLIDSFADGKATKGYRRKGAFILFLSFLFSSVLGQGWVNFRNDSESLFSVRNAEGAAVGLNGTYYFSLLTAPAGTIDIGRFTFSGVYATNLSVAGRFFGGSTVAVPNWAIGASESYLIAGWSASLGIDWNPGWLDGVFSVSGNFGLSSISTGIAGGFISTNQPPLPPLNLFRGATGIPTGFSLYPVSVPEPSAVALAVTGMGLMLFAYRRTWVNRCLASGPPERRGGGVSQVSHDAPDDGEEGGKNCQNNYRGLEMAKKHAPAAIADDQLKQQQQYEIVPAPILEMSNFVNNRHD